MHVRRGVERRRWWLGAREAGWRLDGLRRLEGRQPRLMWRRMLGGRRLDCTLRLWQLLWLQWPLRWLLLLVECRRRLLGELHECEHLAEDGLATR